MLQLFLTASLQSLLLILQWDIYSFLCTILKAMMFFPEVKSAMVHALSSSVSGGAGDTSASIHSLALGRASSLLSGTAEFILITL